MSNNFNIKITDETVLRYLECYGHIDLEEIEILRNLFPMLKDHKLTEGSYDKNGKTCMAIVISPSPKTHRAINLLGLSSITLGKDDKDMCFHQSLIDFEKVLPYVSSEDRICLNTLFEGMSKLDRGVGKIFEINNERYLPIYNYKKSFLDAQEKTR